MRISPLGIFGAQHRLTVVGRWANQDAAITHPNRVRLEANALYAMAIAVAVREPRKSVDVYHRIAGWAKQIHADTALVRVISGSASAPPPDYVSQQGWVPIAFQNALWQLLHAPSVEEGVVDTVMRCGDTDTYAAICGALLGAVHGREAIPPRWTNCLRECRPAAEQNHVRRPRPERSWPAHALELAESLIRQD